MNTNPPNGVPVITVQPPPYKQHPSRRITVKRYDQYQTLLGRDTSAVSIILDIFKYQHTNGTLELPTYVLYLNALSGVSIVLTAGR